MYLIAFLTIFSAFKAHSQINYLQEVNQELRHIFSPLTYPDPDVKFLYERSAKMSDSIFYQNNSPNTNNVFVWNVLYDEVQLEVFDLRGKKVYGLQDMAGGANKIRLHKGGLESGLYLLRLHTTTNSQTVRLIIH